MIVVYILAAIGVLALAMMFYNWLVPDQSEIAPRDSSEDRQLDAEESARALSANLDAPLIDGNAFDMLRNGDEIFPAMLEAIRSAQQPVNLLTHIYWQGDIASQIAAELRAAASPCVCWWTPSAAAGWLPPRSPYSSGPAAGSRGSGRCAGTTSGASTTAPTAR